MDMKKLIVLFGVLTGISLQAQLFTPESVRGAALGGLVGGIVGHNNGGKSAEWAAVGAGAGWLLGTLQHESRKQSRQTVSTSHYPPQTYREPAQNRTHRPNYALSGAVVGGLTGGIVGHNNGGKSAEWAAVGAGAGLVLGGLAEQNARRREATSQPRPAPQTPAVQAQPPQQPPAKPTPTLINSYAHPRTSPMASANSLFGR